MPGPYLEYDFEQSQAKPNSKDTKSRKEAIVKGENKLNAIKEVEDEDEEKENFDDIFDLEEEDEKEKDS